MFIVFFGTGVLIAFIFFSILAEGRLVSAFLMIGLYLLGIALFYALTVEISGGKLKFWFGIGAIQKSVPLSEIESSREVVNPWYYFWGIKSIPGGWFYAIAPGPAVEILLKSGKIIHLGTDQPELLKQAIDAAK